MIDQLQISDITGITTITDPMTARPVSPSLGRTAR